MEQKVAFIDKLVKNSFAAVCPGVSYGIVFNGTVVSQKAHGLRDKEKNLPMHPETLVSVGSTTKAFTSLGLGLLVDQGKITFDEVVSSILPGFEMPDKFQTERMTIRDMLLHRTGMPDHGYDNAYIYQGYPLGRRELVYRHHFMPAASDLRDFWAYNNIMYATAGYLAGQVSASPSWEDYTQRKILDPLSMRSTYFTYDAAKAHEYSLEYDTTGHPLEEPLYRALEPTGPCGSIWSNVPDYMKWIQMHLDEGKVRATGKRLADYGTLLQCHMPQETMVFSDCSSLLGRSFCSLGYGLAWMTYGFNGHLEVTHGGNTLGHTTQVHLYPDAKAGMVFFGNKYGVNQYLSTMARIALLVLTDQMPVAFFDTDNGAESLDVLVDALVKTQAHAMEHRDSTRPTSASANRFPEHCTRTHAPSHALSQYTGAYSNPFYLTLNVTMRDGGLYGTLSGIHGPIKHCDYNTFVFNTTTRVSEQNIAIPLTFSAYGNDIDSFYAALNPGVATQFTKPGYVARGPGHTQYLPAHGHAAPITLAEGGHGAHKENTQRLMVTGIVTPIVSTLVALVILVVLIMKRTGGGYQRMPGAVNDGYLRADA
eukprot:gnl/Trimastix_PCT/4083.p1 GENE.gnl/Trimastix_PCT/4083~~gnl/Trimastix_PCT/4083.p1  ORF type:complete len:660 (+),score=189.47 gnl/Trimastix_PCT/4083:204-1982(+)